MQKILLILSFIFYSSLVAENKSQNNSLFFMIGGSGIGAGIEYERITKDKKDYFITNSLGVSVVPICCLDLAFFSKTIYHYGNFKKQFEVGIGINFLAIDDMYIIPSIGYRYTFDSSIVIKTSFDWVFGRAYGNKIASIPFFGLGIGYNF
jgi:hypothetical protein